MQQRTHSRAVSNHTCACVVQEKEYDYTKGCGCSLTQCIITYRGPLVPPMAGSVPTKKKSMSNRPKSSSHTAKIISPTCDTMLAGQYAVSIPPAGTHHRRVRTFPTKSKLGLKDFEQVSPVSSKCHCVPRYPNQAGCARTTKSLARTPHLLWFTD